ncbi:hypothetical protein GW846_03255 [Candidatus Gracilibacteria bacterium]|nr:hypothetical protein [Candidatus Gracilibacteria bacterium]
MNKKIKIWKKEKGGKVIHKVLEYESIQCFQTYVVVKTKSSVHVISSFEEMVTDVDSFEDLQAK